MESVVNIDGLIFESPFTAEAQRTQRGRRGQPMSKRFKKLSHSLYERKYRIIFLPKYRYRVLGREAKATLLRTL
jgi:hypothetical protein